MHVSCKNCLHFKKVPGEMVAFCKMNRLSQYCEISNQEVLENGVIELHPRELFSFANTCQLFVNMDDREERLQ